MRAQSLNKHSFLYKQAKLILKHIYDFKKENACLQELVPQLLETDITCSVEDESFSIMNPIFSNRNSGDMTKTGFKFINSRNRRKI